MTPMAIRYSATLASRLSTSAPDIPIDPSRGAALRWAVQPASARAA